MSKIKETITAVSAGSEPGAVRIKREEQEQIPEWYFATAMKCAVVISAISAVTAIIIFADLWKVITLAVFGIFFCLIYFASKD